MQIVKKVVMFLLDQLVANLFIAATASKETQLQETRTEMTEMIEMKKERLLCTAQLVLIAERAVKFHLSQAVVNLFIAASVLVKKMDQILCQKVFQK